MLTGFLLPGLGASGLAPWGAVALAPRASYSPVWVSLEALSAGRAGLVAGLRVGQAFGMFLLPGFGVGSSSPWVPGHPTSMCDSGVNFKF